MHATDVEALLTFLRAAERLKHTYRSAWTSAGDRESVAEHSWRLTLMALLVADHVPEVDLGRLLALCVVHDLGEAIGGDVPAPEQSRRGVSKSVEERRDLLQLLAPLPAPQREAIAALWDEYEGATTLEARLAKGLDKLETILQHNQGANPAGFDYAYNLGYARQHTATHPLLAQLREVADAGTRQRAQGAPAPGGEQAARAGAD